MEAIEFNATVLNILEKDGKFFAILDQTLFYPSGVGGQLGDFGNIGDAKVLKVIEKGETILHEIDRSLKTNTLYKCTIDIERRLEIAREHTAQHILSQSFKTLFNIETVSFHMDENYSTIDLETNNISNENLLKAELLANRIVLEDRDVKTYFVDEEEIERLNLRKKIDVKPPIRIVEVEGFDISMCGGTHVNKTGEIGSIKILKKEKAKKDYLRVYFASGIRVIKEFNKDLEILQHISSTLTTGFVELEDKITKMQKENKLLQSRIYDLEKFYKNTLLERLKEKNIIFEIVKGISRATFESIAISLSEEGKSGAIAFQNDDNSVIALLGRRDVPIEGKVYSIGGVSFFPVEKEKFENAIEELKKYFKEG